MAASGLSVLAATLSPGSTPLRVAGGLVLVLIGVRIMRSSRQRAASSATPRGLARGWMITFALTLANPATILSFLAVFAALGAVGDVAAGAALVLGVFLGSAAWWLALACAVGALRTRLSERTTGIIDRVTGAVIALFGAAALLSVLL